MTHIQYLTNVCQGGNHLACKGHSVDGHDCECECHTKDRNCLT